MSVGWAPCPGHCVSPGSLAATLGLSYSLVVAAGLEWNPGRGCLLLSMATGGPDDCTTDTRLFPGTHAWPAQGTGWVRTRAASGHCLLLPSPARPAQHRSHTQPSAAWILGLEPPLPPTGNKQHYPQLPQAEAPTELPTHTAVIHRSPAHSQCSILSTITPDKHVGHPSTSRLRQKDPKFKAHLGFSECEASLDHTARPSSKTLTQKPRAPMLNPSPSGG